MTGTDRGTSVFSCHVAGISKSLANDEPNVKPDGGGDEPKANSDWRGKVNGEVPCGGRGADSKSTFVGAVNAEEKPCIGAELESEEKGCLVAEEKACFGVKAKASFGAEENFCFAVKEKFCREAKGKFC
jgi:hypothetical protein